MTTQDGWQEATAAGDPAGAANPEAAEAAAGAGDHGPAPAAGAGAPGDTVLPPRYRPQDFEEDVYRFWMEQRAFHADRDAPGPVFSMVIPPPNVTGNLHIGHALNNTMQDILARWHRMQGDVTLWVPGTDHAGIATQHVVEVRLAKEEGLRRQDLGRERFLERVWAWKNQYEANILGQLRRLGASVDWDRLRFTMDEGCSRAVREVFVRLYEKGLIYRGDYMVNWCPVCHTALADIEVEHEEREGRLYHLRYPLVDGDGAIQVATTRPETMLGDTAVAVHPDDDRYRHLVGRRVRLPLVGREIPIIADEYVDPEFGTGAVKVTPAHDPNDFEMGRRHGLEQVQVIGFDGRMTEAAGPRYAGLDRQEARRRVVADLEEGGHLVKVEPHHHSVGVCYRCGTVIEPLVSRQWFIRMKPLAEPAMEAVRTGRTRIVPERFTRVYLHWLENVRDWCISRQIWWGHRIPAWYCQRCGETVVAREDPERCPRCGSAELHQDEDVLDTWFSSALWPFSTLGWPDKDSPDLRRFYPTSVLVTGYDILFFWVARMMVMGLEFMGDVPFRTVLLHGLVRDAKGQKMSKSRGNVVDPLEVIDKYGADALRFTLVTGLAPGNDARFSWERAEASRNFANKLWNAARFVLMNLQDFDPARGEPERDNAADRWILARLDAVTAEVQRLLEAFELGEAARALYNFIWDEFCDWYIELVKPRLAGAAGRLDPTGGVHRQAEPAHAEAAATGGNAAGARAGADAAASRYAAQYTLWQVLEQTLRLLHPFMPFISETVWQKLPRPQGAPATLALAPWPRAGEAGGAGAAGAADQGVITRFQRVIDTIHGLRSIRAEFRVPPGRKAHVLIYAEEPAQAEAFAEQAEAIRRLAGVDRLEIRVGSGERPAQAAAYVGPGVVAYMPLAGLIDLDAERRRLARERDQAEAALQRVRAKLANQGFVTRAPAEVVEQERQREQELVARLQLLAQRLAELG
ncbi:valyl-tRNA synthetase [Thermaerobacter marianensis DSM 12885]|uniref:Valine--tRNA ligase n=1 Tax=Thermaerobacter marianensis (strain ATCC 700841 / DSM 12885 / JCM 10246 / 7p75a) TaxID=644966 RepID=E6SKE3_THEM7|nr:valine--tRNA ligase [Thermaerobacter marianensis]ADU52301.1 valyl-tRNA synthetase [Thermaerobacter marianensis DSM 12885]